MLVRLQARAAKLKPKAQFDKYRLDPCGYARDVLKVEWTDKQCEIAEALIRPPYRVLVKASHSVGKSMLAGGLVNWRYDCFRPGVTLTTAPTARQVRDVLWKEVRRQRSGRGGFPGPKIPRLEDAEDHFAHGFTARDATSFQGQHELDIFLIFDESVGVSPEFWEAAETMCQGHTYAWLAIHNPTDTTSQAYREEDTGKWHVIDMPAPDHPNIAAELSGAEPPYPSAIRLGWLEDKLRQWCEPVNSDVLATDLEWPPGTGQYLRPGPLAQARLLARWPTQTVGVWSDMLWSMIDTAELEPTIDHIPEIGCDVARFGDDFTSIHARCGPSSVSHETGNGWDTSETVGRVVRLARKLAQWQTERLSVHAEPFRAEQIPIKVDDDGVGGGVVDQLRSKKMRVVPVNSGCRARDEMGYPNVRSELWFNTQELARAGMLSIAVLDDDTRRKLKQQALSVRWKVDHAGRRVVETKDDLKKADRLGRSPDDMDSFNLAYYRPATMAAPAWVKPQAPAREADLVQASKRDRPEQTGAVSLPRRRVEERTIKLFGT